MARALVKKSMLENEMGLGREGDVGGNFEGGWEDA